MHSIVINLDRDTDRLDRIRSRLNMLGISVNRFSAITPDKVTKSFHRDYTPVERATAESHYRVWELILSSDEPYVMVCEDDVMFRVDARKQIQRGLELVDKYDPGWHALFCNHSEDLNVFESWTRITNHAMAGCYILSRSGARTLVDMFKDKLLAADGMTGFALQPLNHSYGYFPWLAVQEYYSSNIQNEDHLKADKDKRDRLLAAANYPISSYF